MRKRGETYNERRVHKLKLKGKKGRRKERKKDTVLVEHVKYRARELSKEKGL
jgi:hypothetical protein